MKRTYFVVEGPHDVEVIGRLLGHRGFKRRRELDGLDPFWRRLVPRTFPIDGDLLRRVPVPIFFDTSEWSVAVHSAIGMDAIGKMLRTSLTTLDEPPDAVGVMVDADFDVSARARWERVTSMLSGLDCGASPGSIGTGHPRAGVFVLPDNASTGTLEDVLLACGEHCYPALLASAKRLVEGLDPHDESVFKSKSDRRDFEKPTGRAKAIAGCVASVLRPGKSIQVSIQDNRWLREQSALDLPMVVALREFVVALTS